MQALAKQVLEHATGLPEGTPLFAKELLHLGNRAAAAKAHTICLPDLRPQPPFEARSADR